MSPISESPAQQPQICSTCATPSSYPGIDLDAAGRCNHCREFQRADETWNRTRGERLARLERFIKWAKKKARRYDALVPLSGGKDSTYCLYLATQKFGLKVLAFTFDNGFQSDIARQNIESAIQRSNADHIIVRPNPSRLMRLYAHFLHHTGLFCPACMRGICAGTFALTRQFKTPLVFTGTSQRTEERLVPEIFQDGTYSFFRKVLQAKPFPEDVGLLDFDRNLREKIQRGLFLLSGQRIPFGVVEIQLPDYMDWDYKTIFQTITTEMGWQVLPDRDEHIDCRIEPVAQYLRRVRVPGLVPGALRYSAEIRAGQRDRAAALEEIVREQQKPPLPPELPTLLERLALTPEEFHISQRDCFRHMQFQ